MKQTIAPAIIIGLIILSFVLRSNPGYETSITHLSLLLSISILVCIAFILIKYYKLNLRDESKTFLGFKTKTIEFKRSALIFFIGPIVSILFASFVLTPLSTFTLTQLNSSEAYPLNNQKNRIIKVYETGRRPKKQFVDILCDGKPATLRISPKIKASIESTGELPNLNRGYLGFYYIR